MMWLWTKSFYLADFGGVYCIHLGSERFSTLTVGDSKPSLGNIEPRPPGRMIKPSASWNRRRRWLRSTLNSCSIRQLLKVGEIFVIEGADKQSPSSSNADQNNNCLTFVGRSESEAILGGLRAMTSHFVIRPELIRATSSNGSSSGHSL